MKSRRKSDFLSSRVQYISLAQLSPNPQQPRRSFDEDSLSELAESIRRYGILQPLTVRRQGTGYELVAGERRLRAAAMAGLREVPCLVAQVGEEDSALLALMENLQRRDLDCWEEAEALSRLIARYGLSQEETARRRGLHRGSAAPPAGDASQGPYYLHHQGCPAVPQQRGSGPAPDASGGSQRRLGPSGYRRGDPSDHPYSQAGADIMRRSV